MLFILHIHFLSRAPRFWKEGSLLASVFYPQQQWFFFQTFWLSFIAFLFGLPFQNAVTASHVNIGHIDQFPIFHTHNDTASWFELCQFTDIAGLKVDFSMD